ncbi:A-kinase anchor protein 1, mitochondrial [Bufo bufo]|uniref:A-kinase anchor protein 1, mitochondrial n=1 Tax=Bufo bufo TaxID=8384 RepID=UPI001ABDA987|nr:A-kinase anchor protein 1, mitochondrial [Bufo bufo]XP_040280820.1 A-kinase anchor protein 1, mitochondrial [Bufo bufo]XP_040280821.1 A-kinase anchor protein 1, mitochondrial [Bufo bufo]
MALRLRLILPYTIPGVLALLGWWWFFSRKKDDGHSRHKRLPAPTEVQADSALTELDPTAEIQKSSLRVQFVQLDSEASTPKGTCLVPPVAQVATLTDMQPDSKAEDILSEESEIQSEIFDSLQQSTMECDIELCLGDADGVFTKPTEYLMRNSSEVTQLFSSEELHTVPSSEDGQQPSIDEIETVVKMSVLVQCPQSVINETRMPMRETAISCTQLLPCHLPELGTELQPLKQDQLSPSLELNVSELLTEPVTTETVEFISTDPLSSIKSACTEVMREGNCADILDAFSQCLEKSEQFEEGSATTFFENYEANLVEQLAINIISKVIVAAKQEILASSVGNVSDDRCQVLETTGKMLPNDAQCPQSALEREADVNSKTCAEMDTCESTRTEQPQEENIKSSEVNKQGDFTLESTQMEWSQEENVNKQGDSTLESTQMEWSREENLKSTVDKRQGASILESTQMEYSQEEKIRSTPVLDKDVDAAYDMDSACESTQTEDSPVENLTNILVVSKVSCLEKTDEEQIVSNTSMPQTYAMPNLSPVHKNTDFLNKCPTIMEDSGVGACTSENGICMEDRLQSTILSSVGAYDSLSSSGIELSEETFNVSSEKMKKLRTVENSLPYSNGDVKSDVKNEGPWTGDAEVDHSGGSDVNSMDSVDSGYALGKTEQGQNVKQKMEVKKAELVIWEIEVPKHLVGRLIGKQGRYVSFLKESSGAKIYISTLPYTQDFQICHIEGSQQQVDRALSLIGKKFKELNLTNIYAPPPSMALHSLPMTSWLMLPDGVTVEVIVVNVVNAGHMFVQQHTHPTFHALRGLDQQMYLCYSQPSVPTLPTPVEVGVICAAPAGDDAWWRAQVVAYYKDSEEVEIRYVDYGGYERVKIDILRQIRSDFVTLPFQGAEVLLDNVIPLADEDHFSAEADATANEMTRGTALLAQVTNYDDATGLPLVQLWSMMADEVVSINRTLVERGFAQWIDGY